MYTQTEHLKKEVSYTNKTKKTESSDLSKVASYYEAVRSNSGGGSSGGGGAT